MKKLGVKVRIEELKVAWAKIAKRTKAHQWEECQLSVSGVASP